MRKKSYQSIIVGQREEVGLLSADAFLPRGIGLAPNVPLSLVFQKNLMKFFGCFQFANNHLIEANLGGIPGEEDSICLKSIKNVRIR